MNYKKILKSRKVRIALVALLNFIPDKLMLSLQYYIKTGNRLNWKNPVRFTEKLQVYKIWAKKHKEYNRCVDKFEVRQFIREKGLSNILIPLITEEKAYSSPTDIDWQSLPDRFVVKDTLGGGGNSVIVCKDKKIIDLNEIKHNCFEWIKIKGKHPGRESVYEGRKHRIIIESYIETDFPELGLVDYKFFCFNGKPKFMYAVTNRRLGVGAEFGIYDMDYTLLPYSRADELPMVHPAPKPQNFEEMKLIAQKLSEGIPEVRIDLYSIENKIYFGEMTFFDGSGYMTFAPDEFDFIMGKEFVLPDLNN